MHADDLVGLVKSEIRNFFISNINFFKTALLFAFTLVFLLRSGDFDLKVQDHVAISEEDVAPIAFVMAKIFDHLVRGSLNNFGGVHLVYTFGAQFNIDFFSFLVKLFLGRKFALQHQFLQVFRVGLHQ